MISNEKVLSQSLFTRCVKISADNFYLQCIRFYRISFYQYRSLL